MPKANDNKKKDKVARKLDALLGEIDNIRQTAEIYHANVISHLEQLKSLIQQEEENNDAKNT